MKSWRGSNRDCKLGFFLPKMKQREENIENTKRRRIRIQSSSLKKSTPSFPLDLVQEILLNLPVKSVVRFRCVSKLWSSIITDPYFTNSFDTQSSRRLNLLTFFKKRDKLFVFSFPQQHQNSSESYSSQPLDSYQKKYTKYCSFSITSITESVHGLICFQNLVQRIIWNPSMRQFLTLPKPKSCKDVTVLFLGYDPIEGNHKVVCMPSNKTCHECWVLTLRSARESWRTIKTNHKHLVFTSSYGRCINGVLYYRAYIDETGLRSIIMSFDVRSEKFNMIKLPSNIQCIRCMLIPYQGRLACFDNDVMKSGITLWILEDAETHRWSCKHFHASLIHYDQSLKSGFKLDGITHTGELIYVPNKFFESFNILYFDPDRDSFRKVKFEGVVDDKFMGRNGLGNSRLHTFPNHIDTLVSL